MLLLWVLKTLSCLELLCTMVTVIVFVFVHFMVHQPATTHLVLEGLVVFFFVFFFLFVCLFLLFFFVVVFLQDFSPLYSNFILIGSFNVLDTNSPLYHIMHDIYIV